MEITGHKTENCRAQVLSCHSVLEMKVFNTMPLPVFLLSINSTTKAVCLSISDRRDHIGRPSNASVSEQNN
ncbi:hypothetical protein SADUNF_Sadunf06G0115800 [Salix dunnii]|uniref:Uncharacterized protein n=1 Tax=Salix dunnii TaxID=1413687 RepID=A0A835JYS3_9ROSI|nr:hypothetical protein SADUNF_Sadunf06G0115800 [Salix dunnii]